MKRLPLLGTILIATLAFAGCTSAPTETPTPETAAPAAAAADTPAPAGALTQNYMDAAEALYANEFEKARTHLTAFAAESTGEVQTLAQSAANAPDLPAMRESFRQLSDLAARMELPAEYAVAYCPMYKAGTRSQWVQKRGEPLRNPYYGKTDAMAGCGTFVN
jgi:hypothetical protein